MSYRDVIEPQDKLWWPKGNAAEVARRTRRIREATRAATVLTNAVRPESRRVCVQAGGHVGLWPQALAQTFEHVYTFEPDYANWLSLSRNVTVPNVFAFRAVLGDHARGVRMARDKPYSGVHYIDPGSSGPVPMLMLDCLGLGSVDLLVLDVEGAEWLVLRGAERLIRQSMPVITVEHMRWGARLGYGTLDDIRPWLVARGYDEGTTIETRDVLFRPRESW